jgi:serine/threonine protein kinase/tetratricopeptide (TPR) repeat protein
MPPIGSTEPLSPSSAEAFDKLAPLRGAGPRQDPGARTDADATEPGLDGVARSSTAKLPRGTVVGRHVVVERIGAGGMGVVYAAFDPKLDRKIALKLLLGANDSEARERLVREAQAMAMLSHPNVVAVHDVGTMMDQVWLAMEFIDGQTFGAWCRERPRHWSEVLRILQAVGLGLVAAHKEGLVHRDLKPDNVMIGKDSRARIMDFGLARAVNQLEATVSAVSPTEVEMSREWLAQPRTKTGAILGTVPYMSPEQISGARTVDARSDQFAFCVMLWEALYGERPFAGETLVELAMNVCDGRIRTPRAGYAVAPRWARQVLIRGLKTDPSRRHPSMEALLAELERGQRRTTIRRSLAGVGVLAFVAAGAAGWQRYDRGQRVAACEAVGEEISQIWNDETKTALEQSFLASGASYAATTYEKVVPWVDRWSEQWSEMRIEQCLQTMVYETRSLAAEDLSTRCLVERRDALAGVLSALQEGDASALQLAVPAVARLPRLELCADQAALARQPPPPDATQAQTEATNVRQDLMRVRGLMATGQIRSGEQRIGDLVQRAKDLAYAPLVAEAQIVEGMLARKLGQGDRSEELLTQAYVGAGSNGADELALAAILELVYTVGVLQRKPDKALLWAKTGEVLVRRAGQEHKLNGAVLLSHIGAVHQIAGDYTHAKDVHERSRVIFEESLGPEHPSVTAAISNIAIQHIETENYEEAIRLSEQALELDRRILGPNHPDVALSLHSLATIYMNRGEYARSKVLHEEALAILEAAFGDVHPTIAVLLNSLGNLYTYQRAYADALPIHERALRIREATLGPDHPDVAQSLSNLGSIYLAQDKLEQAQTQLERALDIWERAYGPEHPDVADALTNLADVSVRRGAFEPALQLHERALTIRERALGPEHASVGQSLFNLGSVHRSLKQTDDALRCYVRACEIFERSLGAEHPVLAVCLGGIANIHNDQGDRDAAISEFTRALAIQEKMLGADHPDVATLLNNLAGVYEARGDFETARGLYARALTVWEKLGPTHTDVAYALVGLGKVALAENDADTAISLLERAVTIRDGQTAPPEDRAEAHFALGRALWEMRQLPRARTLVLQARMEYTALGAVGRTQLAEVDAWLRPRREGRSVRQQAGRIASP